MSDIAPPAERTERMPSAAVPLDDLADMVDAFDHLLAEVERLKRVRRRHVAGPVVMRARLALEKMARYVEGRWSVAEDGDD